mmetsp:Transcript_13404/g.22279  ORF Transcript_13404/g.22279 Transcript_13404/m.22279 type:complete len:967 (+) Transcript_13404:62-2962(+)
MDIRSFFAKKSAAAVPKSGSSESKGASAASHVQEQTITSENIGQYKRKIPEAVQCSTSTTSNKKKAVPAVTEITPADFFGSGKAAASQVRKSAATTPPCEYPPCSSSPGESKQEQLNGKRKLAQTEDVPNIGKMDAPSIEHKQQVAKQNPSEEDERTIEQNSSAKHKPANEPKQPLLAEESKKSKEKPAVKPKRNLPHQQSTSLKADTPSSAAMAKIPAASAMEQSGSPTSAVTSASSESACTQAESSQLQAESSPSLPASSSPAPPPPRKWFPGMKEDLPPNKGSKRVPVGKPDCLAKKTFVVTGTQDSLEREEVEQLIKKYGGKVTTSVSGKTSFLLLGLDPSTGAPFEGSKTKKARELKTPIIDEDDLLDMIRVTAPQPEPEPEDALMHTPPPAAPPLGMTANEGPKSAVDSTSLWAEKYRPTSVEHLVGNADHIKRLVNWLSTWHDEERRSSAAGDKVPKGQSPFVKAALLSGPPGVGKTSAARITLRQFGYDVVEFNASDTRSEKVLRESATDMLGNTSIADFATGGGASHTGSAGKMALVMDEVDGMSSGDRGGMQLLIKLIQRSKMPVICICNDRQSQKVKSLVNHCLDLRFRRPFPREVAVALRRVAAHEGYSIDGETLERVASACNADIRQMLNLLQMWRPSGDTLKAEQVNANMNGSFKDIDVGPFDVADKFFKEAASPLDKRIRHYFVDSSMTPLLVQDCYLNSSPSLPAMAPVRQQLWLMNQVVKAADAIAEADVVGTRIAGQQQWGLAPLHGVLSCAKPGFHMACGNIGRLNFPAWLGRNSTSNKRQRILRECAAHMQAQITASKGEVRYSYIPALRGPLLKPLRTDGTAGVEAVLEMMHEYSLSKDDFDAIMELQLVVHGAAADIAQVPANVKSALTRKYNQSHMAVQKMSAPKRQTEHRFTEDGAEGSDEADDDESEAEAIDTADTLVKPTSKGKGKESQGGKGKGKAKAK